MMASAVYRLHEGHIELFTLEGWKLSNHDNDDPRDLPYYRIYQHPVVPWLERKFAGVQDYQEGPPPLPLLDTRIGFRDATLRLEA